jgi:uncharacterized membrane protein YphA (DoxX/SURF4 family)
MATITRIHAGSTVSSVAESSITESVYTTLKYLFTVVPIVAGADKFTNLLTSWDAYLNPLVTRIVPLSGATLLHVVGVIEIVAGILVFARPRIGGFVVMGWLLAIALQLVAWGHFLDVAVRDIVIAISGPLSLARLAARRNEGV